jgi:hypothetical protein
VLFCRVLYAQVSRANDNSQYKQHQYNHGYKAGFCTFSH